MLPVFLSFLCGDWGFCASRGFCVDPEPVVPPVLGVAVVPVPPVVPVPWVAVVPVVPSPAPKRRALERLVVETGQAERPANPDLIACAMAMTE